jgi:hypothetical protein
MSFSRRLTFYACFWVFLWLGHEYSTLSKLFPSKVLLYLLINRVPNCVVVLDTIISKTHFLASFSILDQEVPNRWSAISCCVWTWITKSHFLASFATLDPRVTNQGSAILCCVLDMNNNNPFPNKFCGTGSGSTESKECQIVLWFWTQITTTHLITSFAI